MKSGSNKNINKDHKKLPPPIVIPHDKLEMLMEKRNDEKIAITLLIMGDGLIAYHFW